MSAGPMPDATLRAGELLLREPRDEDVAALARACADPDLASWVHPPAPDAGEAAGLLLERLAAGRRDGSLAPFVVVAADGGEILGLVALMREGDPEVAEV